MAKIDKSEELTIQILDAIDSYAIMELCEPIFDNYYEDINDVPEELIDYLDTDYSEIVVPGSMGGTYEYLKEIVLDLISPVIDELTEENEVLKKKLAEAQDRIIKSI